MTPLERFYLFYWQHELTLELFMIKKNSFLANFINIFVNHSEKSPGFFSHGANETEAIKNLMNMISGKTIVFNDKDLKVPLFD